MVTNAPEIQTEITSPVPMGVFEGQEKRLVIHFDEGDFDIRSIGREGWSEVLTDAACTIISLSSTPHFDGYVLSESSLFVYPKRLMLKTCGTTTTLHVLPRLRALAEKLGTTIKFVQYSRADYMFPEQQPQPYHDFDEEVSYLREFFPEGITFQMGKTKGWHYHVFLADYTETQEHNTPAHIANADSKVSLEIIMTELDRSSMDLFMRMPWQEGLTITSADVTKKSGVGSLFPEAMHIDDFFFDPCGYSMNGLLDDHYATIHVTPEEVCKYVSFETTERLTADEVRSVVRQVVGVFKPARYSVIMVCSEHRPNFSPVEPESGATLRDSTVKVAGGLKFLKTDYLDVGLAAILSPTPGKLPHSLRAQLSAYDPSRLMDHIVAELSKEFDIQDLRSTKRRTFLLDLLAEHSSVTSDPFYVVDLSEVARMYQRWTACLPRVRPFYAMKCNGDVPLIKLLAAMGCGFDCASRREIQTVRSLGFPADDIIFANPAKMISHLQCARDSGVRRMTFDNESELRKIAQHYPGAHLLLRIITDDSNSQCAFSMKFGASMDNVPDLLSSARQLNLNVVGVSFHVGSGATDVSAFEGALRNAKVAFDIAKENGFSPSVLDIGGGFCAQRNIALPFETAAERINVLLDDLFDVDVEVIAEPGRFFAETTHTLCANVYSVREVYEKSEEDELSERSSVVSQSTADDDSFDGGPLASPSPSTPASKSSYIYYINDGVYGSFNCLLFDHAEVHGSLLAPPSDEERVVTEATVFGPTCDGLDRVLHNVQLPKLQVGDWLQFDNMGAYTCSAASSFNGFGDRRTYYTRSSW